MSSNVRLGGSSKHACAIRVVASVAFLVACALLALPGTAVLGAQRSVPREEIRRPDVTPPPLPFSATVPVAASPENSRPGRHLTPLHRLPPLPARPLGKRSLRSATGATITVTAQGSCTSVGQIFSTGCGVTWQSSSLPAGTHQDYLLDPTSTTPASTGSSYTTTPGPSETTTFAVAGTYVLASLNSTSNAWDAVLYVDVGSAPYFNTYADPYFKTAQSSYLANGTNTVYVNATGLNPAHSYVLYIDSTSLTGACVFVSGLAPPYNATGPAGLCNIAGATSQPASGGTLTVSWAPPAATPPGTYSIVIYDTTAKVRVAQRQIAISSASASWSMVPNAGNPSPAPGSATPSPRFAFDSLTDAADSGFIGSLSGLVAGRTYKIAVSDPHGGVSSSASVAANGSGTLSYAYNFVQSPQNFTSNTYTITALDPVANAVAAASAFQLVGYSAQVDFTSPFGTAIANSGGSVTTGIQFLNNGDTRYGTGNGDALGGFVVTTDSKFAGVSFSGGATSQTLLDAAGNTWNATIVCSGGCGGGAGNKTFTISVLPQNPGVSIAPGASLTLPNVVFTTSGRCGTPGCGLYTTLLPVDGRSWSVGNDIANPIYFTDAGGTALAASGQFSLYGYRNGGTTVAGKDVHGYTPRSPQAIYAAAAPSAASTGAVDIFSYVVTNNSTGGTGSITALQVSFPSTFAATSAQVNTSIGGASAWAVTPCATSVPPNVACFKTTGSNTGIAPGSSQTIYIELPPPSGSFWYTDVTGQATTPANFPVTAGATTSAFVGSSNPLVIDNDAIAAYSLNPAMMTAQFAPGSVGSNSGTAGHSVTISLQNTSTANDPYPDYLDAVIIAIPTANPLNVTPPTSSGVSPAGWSLLGTTVSGANTLYWFGLCSAQFNVAYAPSADGLPNCGAAVEQSSLAPGATLSFATTIQTQTGPVNAVAYVHGANGDGWSQPLPFTLNVSSTAVSAGFGNIGAGTTPPAVPANTEPQVGADSSPTLGNTYVYTITNTGATTITSGTITIPGLDASLSNGTDATNVNWTITSAPTLSGAVSGCSVTSYSSATTSGGNGAIAIGGSSCALAPNATLNVTFTAKAPYRVNSTFKFPTVVNGNTNASEAWYTDTYVQVVLSATMQISVDPVADPTGGSNPTVSCPACTFDTLTNTVNIAGVASNTTKNYLDVVRARIYTDASNPEGWKLYVSGDNNPAGNYTGTSVELYTQFDPTASTGSAGLNSSTPGWSPVPTAAPGLQLVDTGANGATTRRNPYDAIMSYQLNIGTEPLVPHTVNLTFTWIPN